MIWVLTYRSDHRHPGLDQSFCATVTIGLSRRPIGVLRPFGRQADDRSLPHIVTGPRSRSRHCWSVNLKPPAAEYEPVSSTVVNGQQSGRRIRLV